MDMTSFPSPASASRLSSSYVRKLGIWSSSPGSCESLVVEKCLGSVTPPYESSSSRTKSSIFCRPGRRSTRTRLEASSIGSPSLGLKSKSRNSVLGHRSYTQAVSESSADEYHVLGTPPCPCCCSRRRFVRNGLALAPLFWQNKAFADESSLAAKVLSAKESRPEWVDEVYTWLIGASGDVYEAIIEEHKDQILGRRLQEQIHAAAGHGTFDIVELGVGTGTNFAYYTDPCVHVSGVDPSRAAERYARSAAQRAGLTDAQFTFMLGVGEGLPLADASADAVVSTLVLCSAADVNQTLSEVRRVLRPGGVFYLIEHVAAPAGTSLRRSQEFLDPLQQFVADGCHLTRDPYLGIQDLGFSVEGLDHVNVKGLSLLSPHLVGSATRAA